MKLVFVLSLLLILGCSHTERCLINREAVVVSKEYVPYRIDYVPRMVSSLKPGFNIPGTALRAVHRFPEYYVFLDADGIVLRSEEAYRNLNVGDRVSLSYTAVRVVKEGSSAFQSRARKQKYVLSERIEDMVWRKLDE